MKLMPASRARWTMRSASASSAWSPNIIAPRQSDETSRLLLPSLRCVTVTARFADAWAWPRCSFSEDRQHFQRHLAPLPADRVELAVVLDRVHEGVEPLQLVILAATQADAE